MILFSQFFYSFKKYGARAVLAEDDTTIYIYNLDQVQTKNKSFPDAFRIPMSMLIIIIIIII